MHFSRKMPEPHILEKIIIIVDGDEKAPENKQTRKLAFIK